MRRPHPPDYLDDGTGNAVCLSCGVLVAAAYTGIHTDWHTVLAGRISTLFDRVVALKTRADNLDTQVAANTSAIADLTTRVASLEARVTALGG